MGAIRSAREQLDTLGTALEILQTVVTVISDPTAIGKAKEEFLNSMTLCEAELKKHEEALKTIDTANEKLAELKTNKEQFIIFMDQKKQELDIHHTTVKNDLAEKTSTFESSKATLLELQNEIETKHAELNDHNLSLLAQKQEFAEKQKEVADHEAKILERENAHKAAVGAYNEAMLQLKEQQNQVSVREEAMAQREDSVVSREKKLRVIQ